MRNYICADLKRIARTPQRLVLLALCLAAAVVMVRLEEASLSSRTAVSITGIISVSYALWYYLVGGVIELIFVLVPDFKAKTMQAAIGMGMPRRKVVLSKQLELAIVAFADTLVLLIAAAAMYGRYGVYPGAEQWRDLVISLLGEWMTICVFSNLAMIPVFLTQMAPLGVLIYVVLSFNAVPNCLNLLEKQDFFAALHLSQYTFTAKSDEFIAQLTLGHFSWPALVWILGYVVAAYLIAAAVFEKKELEF